MAEELVPVGVGESVGAGLASADDVSTGDGLGDGVALAFPALAMPHAAAQSARMKTARRETRHLSSVHAPGHRKIPVMDAFRL